MAVLRGHRRLLRGPRARIFKDEDSMPGKGQRVSKGLCCRPAVTLPTGVRVRLKC